MCPGDGQATAIADDGFTHRLLGHKKVIFFGLCPCLGHSQGLSDTPRAKCDQQGWDVVGKSSASLPHGHWAVGAPTPPSDLDAHGSQQSAKHLSFPPALGFLRSPPNRLPSPKPLPFGSPKLGLTEVTALSTTGAPWGGHPGRFLSFQF